MLIDALKEDPSNHWLLTRLGTTYYEQKNYKKALAFSRKALKTNPNCPIVLWDLAGALFALEKFEDAFSIYRSLLSKDPQKLAKGPCGEGISWTISLLIDCFFRLGLCFHEMGDDELALKSFLKFLEFRSHWTDGIHSIQDATEEIAEIHPTSENIENDIKKATRQLIA